jgi:putative DNA primase/helicase
MLDGYSLIYSTDTAFDGERRMIVGLGPLRAAAGKALVREWLEHPARRTVLPDEVGFDPAGEDPRLKCNLWGGWPTVPQSGRCERLLELVEYLCNHNPAQQRELSAWLLKWIAYPIQHPGAKMQTAVLMHGPEGTGKNTLFGAVRKIYGRYAVQFSQVELESNFNGWASGKLLGIGNEVVSRTELYHIQGRLKSMITEPEWVINEKMLPARSEQNHCNFVFFSNRIDIAKLDHGDRRYCVIWTPPALSARFYAEVAEELRNGGVEALHHYLLHLPLGDFSPHTKPPETSAKQDLVELGMDSTERFYRDWTLGHLELPAVACRSEDLYAAYRSWTAREGIGKPAQKQTLLTAIGKRPGVVKAQERYNLSNLQVEKRTVVFVNGAHRGPDDGSSRGAWIGRQVENFASALALWSNV